MYSPIVPHREETVIGPNWQDCKFVKGNHPHFMGSRYHDLVLRNYMNENETRFANGSYAPVKIHVPIQSNTNVAVIAMLVVVVIVLICVVIFKSKVSK